MRWDVHLYLFTLLFFSLVNLSWTFVETKGCNRTIRSSVGWIRWTGRMGRCIVRIRAPLRDPEVIELKIRRLQVGFLKDAQCRGAYVQFVDTLENINDKTGRYCGHVTGNATRLFLRRGPDLIVVMDSEVKFADDNPVMFSAQFSVVPARLAMERHRVSSSTTPYSSTECPLECSIRNDRRACRLVSPGYPGVYPRGMRCRISLESDIGRFRIGGSSDDFFNLMNYTSQNACQMENCEDRVENPHEQLDRSIREARYNEEDRQDQDREEESEFVIGHKLFSVKKKIKNTGKHVAKITSPDEFPVGENDERVSPHLQIRGGSPQEINMRENVFGDRLKVIDYQNQGSSSDGQVRHEKQRVRKKSLNSFEGKQQADTKIHVRRNFDRPKITLDHNKYGVLKIFDHNYIRRYRHGDKLGSSSCLGDYLAVLENVNGKILEISKFCGEGYVPHILSRGKNLIVEFYSEKEGTIMHNGFQLTVQETETSNGKQEKNCDLTFTSSEVRSRETIRSLQSWYAPHTLCTYKFIGKSTERISIHMKIVRNVLTDETNGQTRNSSLPFCTGNEIAVYNGAQPNGTSLMWSYCDISHQNINNIQVPLMSSGNVLLIQYYSAKGSYNGQEFTYTISYKFIRKVQNSTSKRQIYSDLKVISLRPVNLSALNLNENENCDCDFSDRIGSFKSWFMVLVVLGIISFLGAIFTIVALSAKFARIRSKEKKLLQTPKR